MQTQNTVQAETKTDIDIVQELLAMFSSRKEVIEKLESVVKEPAFLKTLHKHKQQTESFIKQLMDELSLHGDAVLSDVNRTHPYFEAIKNIPVQGNVEESEVRKQYESAENKLKEYYTAVVSSPSQEPVSLEKLLQQQMQSLQD